MEDDRSKRDRDQRSHLLRARDTLARSLYRELRRGGYDDGDVVRFVNSLLDQLGAEAGDRGAEEPLRSAEHGLAGPQTARQVLAFECERRAREPERSATQLLEMRRADGDRAGGSAEEAQAAADVLEAGIRRTDFGGYLGQGRWIILLHAADEHAAERVRERLRRALRGSRSLGPVAFRIGRTELRPKDTPDEALRRAEAEGRSPARLSAREEITGGLREGVLLLLGGGAARAAAHVGVLDALREREVPIRGIAACSGAALVAAMHAIGMGRAQIVARLTELTRSATYHRIARRYVEARRRSRPTTADRYFLRSSAALLSDTWLAIADDELFDEFVELLVGPDRDLESLPLPLSLCATDLADGSIVEQRFGSLHAALKASCAVPGLFSPQQRGERWLVDGGLTTEVPEGVVLRARLAVPRLAVYLERPRRLERELQNSQQVAARLAALMHRRLAVARLELLEHVVRIPVEDFGWLELRRASELAEVGERAARDQLDALFC